MAGWDSLGPWDVCYRLTREIADGKRTDPDDPPEIAEKRRRMAREFDEIKRRGGVVDIPPND